MILTLIEHDQGVIDPLTFSMLTAARGLAQAQDAPLHAVLIGADVADLANGLGDWGVTAVHLIEQETLDNYAPNAWAACVVAVMAAEKPEAIVGVGGERSNEVMAHVAARTDLPLAANCLTIQPEEDAYFVTRIRWGGTLHEEARLRGEPKLLTIAALGMDAEEAPSGAPEIITVIPELTEADLQARVVSRIAPERGGVSLADAPVVVSGGRGVGSAEGFAPLVELANMLGGAVGCSRVVTNNGWRPHAEQVGQTGTRVAPDLYIACGISGASQHMSACSGAKHILAINTDPDAPILMKADMAIIGDLHEVIPAIIAQIMG
ncbi:MAG: electron transfer flavoprotein subunit alpha/FixB family protein [Chloroflexi bacterium]|nr:electron transfer flavoprotein subunit alpha/FixB family protein [Chloroflexota bacterium]